MLQQCLLVALVASLVSAQSFLAMTVNSGSFTDNRFVNITDFQSGTMKTITKFGADVGALPGACAYDPALNLFYFTTINMTSYNESIYVLDSITGKTKSIFTTNKIMSFLHVDRASHKVFTTTFINHTNVVVSINFEKNTLDVITTIQSDGLTSDGSTYCQHGHKFFFVMNENNGYWLYVIDTNSGKLAHHVEVPYFVINMELDSRDGTLYASVINTDKNSRELVAIDHKTGKITRTVSTLVFSTANGYMSYFDEVEGLYYYVASLLGVGTPVLVAVDVKTGTSRISHGLEFMPECLKR
jgi:hypothetical protein